MLALKSASSQGRKISSPPTEYAELDELRLNAARKEREERLYENSNVLNKSKPAIYDNINEMDV